MRHLVICRCPLAFRAERCSLPTWRYMIAIGPVMALIWQTPYGMALWEKYANSRGNDQMQNSGMLGISLRARATAPGPPPAKEPT